MLEGYKLSSADIVDMMNLCASHHTFANVFLNKVFRRVRRSQPRLFEILLPLQRRRV